MNDMIFCESEEEFREIKEQYNLKYCGESEKFPGYVRYRDIESCITVYFRCEYFE